MKDNTFDQSANWEYFIFPSSLISVISYNDLRHAINQTRHVFTVCRVSLKPSYNVVLSLGNRLIVIVFFVNDDTKRVTWYMCLWQVTSVKNSSVFKILDKCHKRTLLCSTKHLKMRACMWTFTKMISAYYKQNYVLYPNVVALPRHG